MLHKALRDAVAVAVREGVEVHKTGSARCVERGFSRGEDDEGSSPLSRMRYLFVSLDRMTEYLTIFNANILIIYFYRFSALRRRRECGVHDAAVAGDAAASRSEKWVRRCGGAPAVARRLRRCYDCARSHPAAPRRDNGRGCRRRSSR